MGTTLLERLDQAVVEDLGSANGTLAQRGP